ncbi:MAG: DUF126 domain-containing protein [Nitrososphaera sp.]
MSEGPRVGITKVAGCKRIVGGRGQGPALVSAQPLNFLAMIDPRTGVVKDQASELYGKSIAGTTLVFPFATGSSVGAYVFYSIGVMRKSPSAIVCTKADITTASGCAIAKIPLVDLPKGYDLASICNGAELYVDADQGTITEKIKSKSGDL